VTVPLRVLILNQFFYPDVSATSQLMTDLAEDLAGYGAQVTALSANVSYVGGQTFPGSQVHGQVRIERVPVIRFSRDNIWKRLGSYLSFYISAFFRLLRLPRQDVILVLTTPPLIALVAYAIRLIKGPRMVYLVQDVYPDIAFAFGLMQRQSVIGRTLEAVATFLLKRADAVIVLGECMRERLAQKGIRNETMHVVPNWADGNQIIPVPHERNPFRAAHGLEGKFVVLYSGNMGRAHDFTAIFRGIKALASEKDLVFVFIGEGPKKAELEAFAKAEPDVNVRIMGYVPREELKLSMSAADLSVVAVADGLEGLVVPSKLYGVMASGRPVLYVGPVASEAARTVTATACGFVVGNSDPSALTDAILAVRNEPALRARMGAAAREAFIARFDRPLATRRYFEILQSVTKV